MVTSYFFVLLRILSFSQSPYMSLDLSKLSSFYNLFNLFFQIAIRPHIGTDMFIMTVKVAFDISALESCDMKRFI